MFFLQALSLFLVAALVTQPATAETSPRVVINELQWMGTSASSADEWVELRNTTTEPVDISGWSLTKKSSGQEVPMLTIPPGSQIPPGGIWMVSNYKPGPSSVLAGQPQLVSTDVALSNSALQIKLYAADKTLVDAADDGSGNPLAGKFVSSEKVFASMERNPIPGDGSQATSWHTATKTFGLVETAAELATPGWPNSNGRPVAAAGSDMVVAVGQTANFDGSDSSDPEQQPLTWHWDFGDGTGSAEVTPTHTYAAAGAFVVQLAVSDGTDEAVDTLKVTVNEKSIDPESAADAPPPVPPSSCRGLRLWSVVPNPVGTDEAETITVKNETASELTLDECWLAVGQSEWAWPTGSRLAAGQTLVVPYTQSHLRLSNSGGIVRLVDTDRQALDSTTYSTAAEGGRWVQRTGGWGWEVVPTAAKKKTAKKKTAKPKTNKNVPPAYENVPTIAELQNYASGDFIRVSGTVTSPLHALGDHQATIEDTSGGATIVLPSRVKALVIGQRVQLSGKIRTAGGRRRVVVDENGLRVVGQRSAIAREVQIVDLSVDDTERLMQLGGTVATVTGSRFEVDDGTEVLTVVLKPSTRIVRPRMAAGDRVTVVGILSAGTTGLRLYPRTIEDIRIERILGISQAVRPTEVIPTKASSAAWVYWTTAGAGFVLINSRWLVRRLRNSSQRRTLPAEEKSDKLSG